jgi:sugar/nucleoside kinase (ribokinase family)
MTNHPAVLTVGLHVADILGRYVSEIPAAQGIALLEEIRLTVAGTAAATAVNLAKLGVAVDTVGVVGNDALGEFMARTMTAAGVGCDRLRVTDAFPTSATMLPIRPDGSRPALHVIGSNAALTEGDVPDDALDGVRVLHLGGSCLLPGIDGEASVSVLRRAKERGIITTMDFIPTGSDSDRQALLPCFPFIDYLFPSEEDALSFSAASSRLDAIEFYLAAGVSTVVITMGGEGASISSAESIDVRLPAFDVPVVDTTGCGDAFSAGFIVGLLDGLPVTDAAELGIACGSLVATGLGSDAGIVDQRSIEAFRSATPRHRLG